MKRADFIAVLVLALAFLASPAVGSVNSSYPGLRNSDAYSLSLMKRAENNPAGAGALLAEAADRAPDFPPVYFRLAANELRRLPQGLFTWSTHFIEGIKAYGRNWWWSLNLSGLLLLCLVASFAITLFVTVAVRLPRELPLLNHDITENRRHLVIFLFLGASAALGPVFFLASALMVPGFYFRKKDKALVYACFAMAALLPAAAGWLGMVYSSSSPQIRAIVEVNEGRGGSLALQALSEGKDFESLFSSGLALKESGRIEEAMASFSAAIAQKQDPRAYVNLGNCFFQAGNLGKARELYEKANSLKPSAAAFFNLSRLHREQLDFARGDQLYKEAAALDAARVSDFVRHAEKHPGMTLMDERLGMDDFRAVLKRSHRKIGSVSPLVSDGVYSVLAVLWAVFFAAYSLKGGARAYRCPRCGKIMCPRCEQPRWGQMCKDCYQSLVKLEAIDPKERVSRLLLIHGRQVRRAALMRTLCFAPPGIAYIFGDRVFLGMCVLWAFTFSVLTAALNPYFRTGLYTLRHGWLNVLALSAAALLYAISVLRTRRRQGQGWL